MWDLFISHATEDKSEFVEPLALALERRGYAIWYDSFTLRLGDVLRESIERGLSQSRYGVVVFSKAFFRKNWPQRELNALLEREETSTKVILPVWHGVTVEEVREYSPILATRVAAHSSIGPAEVADAIAKAIGAPSSPQTQAVTDALRNPNAIVVGADDSAAYSSLTDALAKRGSATEILVQAGTYEISQTISISHGEIKIIGTDRESVTIAGGVGLDCIVAELTGISFIAGNTNSPCLNVLGGSVRIHNCSFSHGRDGIMIQRLSNIDENFTDALIEDCLFTQNKCGVWAGLTGKTILRGNRFVRNQCGVINGGPLLQDSAAIARANYFEGNQIADYVAKWDYSQGWVDDFWRWKSESRSFERHTAPRVKLHDLEIPAK